MADTESLRQVDAEIAEKVMGYRWCVWSKYSEVGRFLDLHWEKERAGVTPKLAVGDEKLHRNALSTVPGFSSDIAAAMTVIEKMRERFDVAVLMATLKEKQTASDELASGEVNVEIFRPEDYAKVAEATEKSLPLAICRAALASISEKN